MKKRIASMLLSLAMVFSLLPQGIAFAGDSNTPTISVSSTSALAGETVNLEVTIANNPGVLGATLTLAYDEGLSLQNVKAGDAFSALTFTKPGKFTSPCNFVWDAQELEADEIKDGVILTLSFLVSDSISAGNTLNVRLTCKDSDVSDVNLHSVHIETISGSIGVVDYTPGDVDSDKIVNTTDVIKLRRHLAGGYDNLTINEAAADVNADTYINTTDVILMRRFLAGGYTDAIGNPLKLLPAPNKCNHTLEAVPAHDATCTESGNTAYWRCASCGKVFSDAAGTTVILLENTVIPATGHTVVIDPAIPATTTSTGLTEGSHCSVCGEVIVAQQETAALPDNSYSISYDVANGDPYLVKLLAKGELSNPNPDRYSVESGLALKNLSANGYRFLGWYDGAGNNAAQVKAILVGTDNDIELYAHWEKIIYTVQFKSDIFMDESEVAYTVDKGVVLPTPRLSNYIFTGWTDEDGKLYSNTKIPVGTTGNITLNANWTSERNKTWTKTKLDDPIIHVDEQNNMLLFVYEIGEVQNVPLYTIKDFGYISGDGITKTETATYSTTISASSMEAYTRVIASATTESSNWTLAKEWNEVTTLDEEYYTEQGMTLEEAETQAKSESNTWNVSSGTSGSTAITKLTTDQYGWALQAKAGVAGEKSHEHTETDTDYSKGEAHADLDIGKKAGNLGGFEAMLNVGGSGEWGDSHSETTTDASKSSASFEMGGSLDYSNLTTNSTVSSSGWSNNASYGGSNTASNSRTIAAALSDRASEKYGFGKSYASGGSAGSSSGFSSTSSASDEYSASVTWSTATSESKTSTWTTQSTKAGYHRWIVAGTAHVFAVVGYDMAEKAFFVYTFSMMDDETHEFEDYSYSSAAYNDHQNGVIPFEIPYQVVDEVAERTAYSAGLKVNQNTGVITGYTGTDNCVIIPEYMNVGDGKVVKVTGISSTAFAGNTNISMVELSDFITEIPDNAFSGCVALMGVTGGNISRIGRNAFSGCISAQICGVTHEVQYLGENAFDGVARLLANPANRDVLIAATKSGAKNLELFVNKIAGGVETLNGVTLSIPTKTDAVIFNGYGNTFTGLTIISDTDYTMLRNADFNGINNIPLQISSPEVVLNDVTATASGIAMVLSAENARLGLQSEVIATSTGANTFLCKNVSLYESNPNADGLLNVKGKLLTCGTIANNNLLVYKSYEIITADAFDKLMHSYTLYFNANGGECSTPSKNVPNGVAIGTLPTPTKQKNAFVGWYLADGTQVTEATVFSDGADKTVYARWTPIKITVYFNANEGSCAEASRKVTIDEPFGTLPSASRQYYSFDGWYTAASGGSKMSESSSSNKDITLFAHWTKNKITVSFNANGGSCGETSRKVTIGDPFGTLPTPSREYYTFDYWYYSSGSKATSSSTSNTDVTLYAHWTPKTYTVSWSNPANATIKVERTSSPSGLGSSGTLSSGSTVYYKDVLKITYAANTGYSLASKGKEQITVSGNIGSGDIYATASANSYTYTIQYRSSNGTNLGSSSATYKFGTTNTISAPTIAGYTTPSSENVKWDATSKTIAFTYYPISIGTQTAGSGWWWQNGSYGITYNVTVSFSERTANSVKATISWTNTITAYTWYGYWQAFEMWVGGAGTGSIRICENSTWASSSNSARSSTKTVTVTVSGLSPTTTSVGFSASTSAYPGAEYPGSFSGTLTIPTY